jgi:hypothetical protein
MLLKMDTLANIYIFIFYHISIVYQFFMIIRALLSLRTLETFHKEFHVALTR